MATTYGHHGNTPTAGHQHHACTFDPRAWLQALVQIGGGYALASGRKLWLVVEGCDPDDLASVIRPLIGAPDRVEAVRTAIEHRSFGEVQA
jgi:hypothetical protein